MCYIWNLHTIWLPPPIGSKCAPSSQPRVATDQWSAAMDQLCGTWCLAKGPMDHPLLVMNPRYSYLLLSDFDGLKFLFYSKCILFCAFNGVIGWRLWQNPKAHIWSDDLTVLILRNAIDCIVMTSCHQDRKKRWPLSDSYSMDHFIFSTCNCPHFEATKTSFKTCAWQLIGFRFGYCISKLQGPDLLSELAS